MYNFRTDLASERRDIYKKANKLENEIDGIESTKEEKDENIKIERVKMKITSIIVLKMYILLYLI